MSDRRTFHSVGIFFSPYRVFLGYKILGQNNLGTGSSRAGLSKLQLVDQMQHAACFHKHGI